jgi:transposase
MITPEMRAEMRRLVIREGWKIETVARRFGVHHSVVRRAIASDREGGGAPPAPSVLEPFKAYVVERLTDYPALTATRLLLELRDRGYTHSVTILRRYVAKVRAPRAKKAYLRVETEPGEVAQVDWGSFGHLRIGNTQRPLSAFAIVLKWSRVLYVDFSLDQRMDTFLRMHARAFAFLGGLPRKVTVRYSEPFPRSRVGGGRVRGARSLPVRLCSAGAERPVRSRRRA